MQRWFILKASSTGPRALNQDYVAGMSMKVGRRRFYILVACDGLGSVPGSEVCARQAGAAGKASVVQYAYNRRSSRSLSETEVPDFAKSIEVGLGNLNGDANLLTTFCVAFFERQALLCAWAGDTRAYILDPDARMVRAAVRDHHDVEGHLTRYVKGNGVIEGGLECNYLRFDSNMSAVCVLTDGVHGCCTERELNDFLLYVFTGNVKSDDNLLSALTNFLGQNIKDNFSIALFRSNLRPGLIKRLAMGAEPDF
jgi:serine/threonine protein phosphatase PrpC